MELVVARLPLTKKMSFTLETTAGLMGKAKEANLAFRYIFNWNPDRAQLMPKSILIVFLCWSIARIISVALLYLLSAEKPIEDCTLPLCFDFSFFSLSSHYFKNVSKIIRRSYIYSLPKSTTKICGLKIIFTLYLFSLCFPGKYNSSSCVLHESQFDFLKVKYKSSRAYRTFLRTESFSRRCWMLSWYSLCCDKMFKRNYLDFFPWNR